MKNGTKSIIGVLIVLAVLILLWKFVIKTKKVTLADGSTIYQMGGNYYTNQNGSVIQINLSEYNRLKTYSAGNCTNPNQAQSVETCIYFGKLGHKNDCGDCVLSTNVAPTDCPATAGPCTGGGTLKYIGNENGICNYACYKTA